MSELFSENNLISFALLVEGYSLTKNGFLHKLLNAKGYTLFRFSYSSMTGSEKVRFIYSLRGRNKHGGMLKELNAIELAAGVVLVPVNATFEFKEFLSRWGIEYEYAPLIMVSSSERCSLLNELPEYLQYKTISEWRAIVKNYRFNGHTVELWGGTLLRGFESTGSV